MDIWLNVNMSMIVIMFALVLAINLVFDDIKETPVSVCVVVYLLAASSLISWPLYMLTAIWS